ncbi:TerD family protein [Streptomyces sp. B6B3]|uniref:TerD family protein n=1 Tax=Streptomyces sp. B6B3 TaxID=3153570 RepID=UPI00325F40FE
MVELAKGGNVPLADSAVSAELRYTGGSLDLSALLLGADGKVRSDGDMVFFNQPSAEGGAVTLADATRLRLEPGALPDSVHQVVVVASCDPGDERSTFTEVTELAVVATQDGGEPVAFRVPPMTGGERAAVLLEFYRRGAGWKVRAVGQGYASGLAGLATDFGIAVDDDGTDDGSDDAAGAPVAGAGDAAEVAAAVAMAGAVAEAAPAAPPAPVAPPPDLTKAPLGEISLEKKGAVSLSLDKQDPELVVTATLEWDGGSDSRRRRGADLDLYALFVPAADALRGATAPGTVVPTGHVPRGGPLWTPDQARASEAWRKAAGDARARQGKAGAAEKQAKKQASIAKSAGVVYYRGLGSLHHDPFIALDGDSRAPGRETVRIVRPDEQGYVLLCAYSALSNGFGSFLSFGARVVVTDGRGSTVTVPLFEKTRTRYWVAIALVDFSDPDGAAIRHIEAYSARMTERRPVLHPDGTIEMNAGPVEFKGRR